MDTEAAAEVKAISSREASRASAAAITMDVAAEAVADTVEVAMGSEPSRALTRTMRLNIASSKSTAGRTDATAAIMDLSANSRP